MEKSLRKRFFVRLLSSGISQKELKNALASWVFFKEESLYETDEKIFESLSTHFPTKFSEIMKFFGSPEDMYAQKILDNEDVSVILFGDIEYPPLLTEIANPPGVLIIRGAIRDMPMLAVVGPRKPTLYGEWIIRKFIPDLISGGFGIVSGWAFGIDALAHEMALKHGWYTIAVIGTGIDKHYPTSHRSLFDSIVQSGGAVVSIFPIWAPALPYHFPLRNEVVVWFSQGVFAPEASERSGTLITTALALDANREVFTVPGDIYRASSVGTNTLIRDSRAKSCLSCADILVEYGIFPEKQKTTKKSQDFSIGKQLGISDDAFSETDSLSEKVIKALEKEHSLSQEAILEYTWSNPSEIIGTLSLLEISGSIGQSNGKYYLK